MSSLQRSTSLAALLAGCAFMPVNSFGQLSFEAHQVSQNQSTFNVIAHGDFNGDGREDLVVQGYSNSTIIYQLYLSDQNGTYHAPITLPASVDAIGDFNHDGRLDFASYRDDSGNIDVFLGNGNGTFQSAKVVTAAPHGMQSLVAADMNHDSKTDLVTVSNTTTASGPTVIMQLWISNGNGAFTKGQTIYPLNQQTVQLSYGISGDFDGDGNPDIALVYSAGSPTTVQIWYCDGAGHLASPYTITDPDGYDDGATIAADVNNDGRSDLVSVASTAGPRYGSTTPAPALTIFAGNANRTLTYTKLATDECPAYVAVADLNGDGLNDLAYSTTSCSQSSAESNLVVQLGEGGNSFGPEQVEYSNSYALYQPWVVRSTTGTKPDVVLAETTGANASATELLTNTSDGSFPGCGLSGFAEGIEVCSPGASATSPVKFSIGAAGPTPMRTVAVWADGRKAAEQLTHAFSNYSFLDLGVALAQGTHAITVYGTGWDNTLQEKSFTLTVNSGACSAPSSPGVHVCQPASGATVSSPVIVQASSTITGKLDRMEIWVDGVKKYTETTNTTLDTALSLAAGTHRFGIFAVNTAGTKWEGVVDATVN